MWLALWGQNQKWMDAFIIAREKIHPGISLDKFDH